MMDTRLTDAQAREARYIHHRVIGAYYDNDPEQVPAILAGLSAAFAEIANQDDLVGEDPKDLFELALNAYNVNPE